MAEKTENKEKKSTSKNTAKAPAGPATPVSAMLTDRRIPIVLGIIFLVWSFFLAVALSSYLGSYRADESVVHSPGITLTTPGGEEGVNNTMGNLGAEVGAFFFDKLFGFGSFLFIILFATLGVNLLLRKRIFKVGKISVYCIILMVWGSVMASYFQTLVHNQGGLSWGGAFGEYLAGPTGILTQMLKAWGTGALLAAITLIALVIMFNFTFDFINNWIEAIKARRAAREEARAAAAAAAMGTAAVLSSEESIFEKDGIPPPVTPANTAAVNPPVNPPINPPINPLINPPMPTAPISDLTVKHELDVEPEEEEFVPNDTMELEIDNHSAEESTPLEINETPESQEEWNEEDQDELAADAEGEEEADAEADFAELTPYLNKSGEYDPTLSLSKYKFPSVEFLEEHGSEKIKIDPQELEKNKNQIIQTLNNYKIEISKIMATIGPTVTLYEIVPAPGVRISKIKSLEDDIALSLAALGIRIIAPIPGKGTIGIEVPNVNKEVVSMRSMIASEKFRNSKMDLPICLGKSISNEIYIADLAKMPHLLMAGATGQGKSVGINSILVSLLYKKHPSELKFVMVDPKKVELSIYSVIEKHYLAKLPGEEEAIITDVRKVVATLNSLCIEMDQRYDLLKKAHVRNLKEYNAKFVARKLNPHKGHKYLPLIVVVVDEFADLIMTAGKEVETPIARLAQLARAIGIHLILATQRPSVNIITGTIKANFPARISFKVASKIDSRTILDMGGAEQLIGRGDMLLSMGSDLTRLQCGFVDTPEVDKIVNFIQSQQGFPEAFQLPEVADPNDPDGGGKGSFNAGDRDELFEDAARIIVQNQMGSTSLIQRRLKLGYNRAGRLMDQLEDAGIVGPNLGSKAREVLYSNEAELENFLNSLK